MYRTHLLKLFLEKFKLDREQLIDIIDFFADILDNEELDLDQDMYSRYKTLYEYYQCLLLFYDIL